MDGLFHNSSTPVLTSTQFQELRPRVLATLIRVLGDIDLAEDATQDAFAAAVGRWDQDGVPQNPLAWLIATGRNKGIDQLRRKTKMHVLLEEPAAEILEPEVVEDDQLRLVFMCCHPDLPVEAQIAMTLREVGGLSTEETAKAFLVSPQTVAQRIVRAKAKIRTDKLPYELPSADSLPERLSSVLHVVYLVFNEGYYASSGTQGARVDLSDDAIRLARHLAGLLPRPEVFGLLSLMLLHDSRKRARFDAEGDIVLLEDQDRTLWNEERRSEGVAWLSRTDGSRHPYVLQARISAQHMAPQTDWAAVCELYDELLANNPSAVVRLNRAVAVSMRDGPAAGVALIDELLSEGALQHYGLAHSARAELLYRAGRVTESLAGYELALQLSEQEPERRHIQRRIQKVKENL